MWSVPRTACATFVGALAVLLLRMFVPGPVGMADNGDGWRVLCQVGANEEGRPLEDAVQLSYGSGPPCESQYVSSLVPLLRVSGAVARALGSTAQVDLRVLAVVLCVLAAAGIAGAVVALPLAGRSRAAVAAGLLLVVADSAFAGYFASVLSEGVAFVGILLSVAGLLLLHRPERWAWTAGGVAVVAGGTSAVNAKGQMLMLLPLLGIALVVARPPARAPLVRWGVPVAAFVPVAVATVLLQSTGSSANAEYREVNAYHAIFHNIVDGEHDARADLEALGLPPSFVAYQGTNWFQPGAAHEDPLYAEYRTRVTPRNVARYYAHHPGRTVEVLHEAAVDHLRARPDNLGSYPVDASQPERAQEHRVAVLSGLTRAVAPAGAAVLWPVWVATAALGVRALRRHRRGAGAAVLLLVSLAAGQSALGGLAEGIEGVKHQTVGLFCTLLGAVLAAATLVRTQDGGARSPRGAAPSRPTAVLAPPDERART